MSNTLRTRGSVRSRNDASAIEGGTARPAAAATAAATTAAASPALTKTDVKNPEVIPPLKYEDLVEGRRRTVVYGLIDLNNKNNLELQVCITMD